MLAFCLMWAGCRSNKFCSFGYGMNKSELFTLIQLVNILLAPRFNGAGILLILKEGCVT